MALAHLQNKPDITIGANWIATSSKGISPVANGEDAFLLGVGFNLPVRRNRICAAVCEANSNVAAEASRYESLKDEIAEEVFNLVARIESLQSTRQLVKEDIIPKATRTFNLSMEEYSNGNVSFVQLLQSWRSLLQYRILEVRLNSEYLQALSSLARSVGETELLRETRESDSPEDNFKVNDPLAPGNHREPAGD